MRTDVNLSVKRTGDDTIPTRTEIKNMNSFSNIVKAVGYEWERQIALLEQGKQVVQETLRFIADFVGTIPGSTAVECGNYLEHDLPDAKRAAKRMCEALRDWTPDRLLYPKA